MSILQKIALGYAVVLFSVASLNYLPIPGLIDEKGYAFGIFALDLFDDSLHFASGLWALVAGLLSRNAARLFLFWFGALYLGDGVLGLVTGSGFLDFGIFIYGWYDYPSVLIKLAANLPHLLLGGIAVLSASIFSRS